jgi:predicted small lipoprotein YifL
MKRVFQTLAVAGLLSLVAGCAHRHPVAAPGAAVDVRIVSMQLKPQHPLPGDKWRAVMTVVNNDKEFAVDDIAYTFVLPDRHEEIGRGYIGKILPGDTLNVSSDDVMLPAGRYRIEARIYPPARNQQSGTPITRVMDVVVGP